MRNQKVVGVDSSIVVPSSQFLYIPFHEQAGDTELSGIESADASGDPILPASGLTVGTLTTDPHGTGYFVPYNAGGENLDNYLLVRDDNGDTNDVNEEYAAAIKALFRLDTLRGVGQLIIAGRINFAGAPSSTGHIIAAGTGGSTEGGVRVRLLNSSKFELSYQEANGGGSPALTSSGTMGVGVHTFLCHIDMSLDTPHHTIYLDGVSSNDGAYPISEANDPSIEMDTGFAVAGNPFSGSVLGLFNADATKNGIAELYVMRLNHGDSSLVPVWAKDLNQLRELPRSLHGA